MTAAEEWDAACTAVDNHLLDCAECNDLKEGKPCDVVAELLDRVEAACNRMNADSTGQE